MHRVGPSADPVARAACDALSTRVTALEPGGTQRWRDLKAPGVAGKTTAQTSPTWKAHIGNLWDWSFEPNANNRLMLPSYHIDHDYAPGTPVYPHVHWMPETTASGTVRWGIEYSWAKRDAAFPSSTTIYIEQAASGVVNAHQVAEVADPGVMLVGLEPDSLIKVAIFRDRGHANDTYPGGAWFDCADLHYLADRDGTPLRSPPFYS